VEQSKKEWELAHMMALKEEEERRMEEADEIFYTREDNQVNLFATSSSSSDEESSDADAVAVRKPSRSRKRQPAKRKERKMVRGRGRGRRGLSRADMKRKRAPSSSSSEESSACVYVDDEKSRDGDPLWREYEQEIAGMESEGFYTDEEQWMFNENEDVDRFSEEEFDFPETELSSPYRESPLWKVAAQSERLFHEKPPPRHVDYGPNEIMSFSKSGRPRKRNKRLCDDEFEIFSPGSNFSDATIPRKPQKPLHKPIYSVVIETNKKNVTAPKKSTKLDAAVAPQPQAPAVHQVSPQSRIVLPFSFVNTGIPLSTVVGTQSQVYPMSTVYTSPLQQTSAQRTILMPQSSFRQPLQWQGQAQGTRPLLLNVESPHTSNKQPVAAKPHDNVFELDFTLNNSNTSANERAYNNAGDELITLNLEPVNLPEESFFEPSNEEERNVFESFASLL